MDASVELLDPGSNALPVTSLTVSESVNGGWTWSADLASVPRYTEEDLSLLDAFNPAAHRFTATIVSGGRTLVLPPLVALSATEDTSGGGTIGGVDEVTYAMTRKSAVLNSSGRVTSSTIVELVSGLVGFTGQILDYEAWEFTLPGVDQSGTTAMLPHINRLCDIACQEWRAVRGVGNTGDLQFYPLDINAAPSAHQPDWSRVERQKDLSLVYTEMSVVKTGRMDQAITVPANQPIGWTTGPIGWIAVQSEFSNVVMLSKYGVVLGSGGVYSGKPGDDTVMHLDLLASNPEAFVIRGRSYADATDHPFSATLSNSGTPANKMDGAWSEDWLPTQTYVEANEATYMWRVNRGSNVVQWDGPLNLGVTLGHVLTWPGVPNSRVESYTHTVGPGGISTQATSAVLAS